jgi:uncharacterized damage-inducible protein DinB
MSVFTNPASSSVEQAAAYITAVLGLLGARDPLEVLRETEAKLGQRVSGLSRELITQAEAPGKWSVRHVLQHLADSELVWGYRIRMVLAHERPPLTGYDQDALADRLHYERADAGQAREDFGVLRRANLRLLEGASRAELQRVGVHAERGEESVAHMMRLYAGHDLLHLRQIDRVVRAVARTV